MLPHRERRHPAALLGVVAVVGAGLLAGAAFGLADDGPRSTVPRPVRLVVLPGPSQAAADPVARQVAAPARRARRPARPVRVLIPAIGVRAAVVRLGLNPDRTLQTPADFTKAGWWTGGARPGEPGAAIVVGHVDSKTGPAAFYALRTLRHGDGIRVVGADGRVVRFVVQRLASFPKARFPSRAVYGATRQPTLRLITCSGQFDTSSGHYLDNTIVFARLAAPA
jgi:hypothetical protein